MQTSVVDFAQLIHPLEPELFFQEYWEQKPLHLSRQDSTYYHPLLKMEDVDTILHFCRPKPPEILVVQNQEQMLPERYVTPTGDLNLNQLYKAYDEGHSIIVNGLDRFWQPLAACCQALRQFLNHHAVANMYLAPRQAKSLKPHYDTHDVFALQVEGSKRWQIYEPIQSTPLLGTFQPIIPEPQLPPLVCEIDLEAGDLLYIPRGFVHQAATASACSIHLTLGIYPTQWSDFITQTLTALSLTDERFRQALPAGFMNQPKMLPSLQAQLEELLEALVKTARAEAGVALLAERFVYDTVPVPDGHFRQVENTDTIDATTRLAKRPNMTCRMSSSGWRARIQFPGNTIAGPVQVAPTLQFIAATDAAFTVNDLPGHYSLEDKVTLARRLVRGGLLRIVGSR
jgi:ribosomal protein L16 Arg81 hydroxylase